MSIHQYDPIAVINRCLAQQVLEEQLYMAEVPDCDFDDLHFDDIDPASWEDLVGDHFVEPGDVHVPGSPTPYCDVEQQVVDTFLKRPQPEVGVITPAARATGISSPGAYHGNETLPEVTAPEAHETRSAGWPVGR